VQLLAGTLHALLLLLGGGAVLEAVEGDSMPGGAANSGGRS
jgi:hypothetical protein